MCMGCFAFGCPKRAPHPLERELGGLCTALGSRELKPSPLEEQPALLTAEPCSSLRLYGRLKLLNFCPPAHRSCGFLALEAGWWWSRSGGSGQGTPEPSHVLEPPNSESQELDPDSTPKHLPLHGSLEMRSLGLGMGEARFAQLLWKDLAYSQSGEPTLAWALQERWRVAAEKSKAESAQRTLEEQRRVMVQQISMEREELERAKSTLLEEQKSVMNKCGEERRRLAAEWAEYFTQQKLSKERAEREAERALQADSQREGTIISLTKEQAELTVRACELRAKEEKLAAEREALEKERQELRLEKDRLHKASLRLQARAQEVEHMSKVASKKYEEGEQALQEAQQMQAEQQGRLQAVQRQQEWLREQEQRVHQEHLSLAQQRLHLDRVRQEVPSSLPGLPSRVQGPAASSLDAVQAPAATTPPCSQTPAAQVSTHLLAKLLLLKHTAEQDHDFLENEQFFLETLKKAPYNMAYHSA